MNASRSARQLVAAVLLSASFAGLLGAAADSSAVVRSGAPIVVVTRHGGHCVTGTECRSTLRIDDASISGDGFVPRRLKASERHALLRAIGKLNAKVLRARPFTGTCPTAYDGTESIYRFRGFPRSLPSCTYDVQGVEAVRLTERLLGALKPR